MRQILKQTSYVFFAQSLTRVIGFFYVIFLAGSLGVSEFGLYTLALAYFSVISSIADLGFNRFLTREVAKDKSKSVALFWNIIILRLTLTSVIFAIFALALYSFDPMKMRVSLILLATLSILPQAIALTFDAIFVANQKLQISAIALFVSGLAAASAGFILVGKGFGTMGAVNALIIGQVIYAVVLLIFLLKYEKPVFSEIKINLIKDVILGSLPYGLLGILGLLYFRVDTILLSYIKGSFETGIYGAAYKFLESITFIPSAFSLALFPILSKLHDSSIPDARKLYFKSLKIMMGLGFIVFLGYILILPNVINIYLPNYLSSITVIKILAISIPFMFAQGVTVSVLLSTDKYLKQLIILSVLTLVFNIVANLMFIPSFGFIGASWVTVLSELLSFIIFFLLTIKKVLKV
ncbi:flippase [Candidatus Daviesbacteria bacterium]|nr:flippase [Candidatus Daviesbacteria bacterium]